MIEFKVKGVPAAKRKLTKARKDLEKRLVEKIRLATKYVHFSITSLTAVWEGTALANWKWSVNQKAGAFTQARGKMETGATNKMGLGSEPRRAVNQAVANAEFNALKFNNPYQNFIMHNTDPKIGEMNAGRLPDAQRSRTQDMIGLTRAGLLSYLKTLEKR